MSSTYGERIIQQDDRKVTASASMSMFRFAVMARAVPLVANQVRDLLSGLREIGKVL